MNALIEAALMACAWATIHVPIARDTELQQLLQLHNYI